MITGDIHSFFAGDLSTTGDDQGDPIGVEFVGGSATSFGIPETLGQPPAALEALGLSQNPHLKFANLEKRGYAVLTVEEAGITCELKGLNALVDGDKPVTLATFTAADGDPHVHQV